MITLIFTIFKVKLKKEVHVKSLPVSVSVHIYWCNLSHKHKILKQHYCMKGVPHESNSHVSMITNPCINQAIHVLLMHRFGIFNIPIPGH